MFDAAIHAWKKKNNIKTKMDDDVLGLMVGHRKNILLAYSYLMDLKEIKGSAQKVFRGKAEMLNFFEFASEKGVKYENLMKLLTDYNQN